MSFHVIATYTAQEGKADVMAEHLEAMTEASRREPGCLDYRVIRSADDPHVFVIIEEYADESAFEAHKSTPHFEEHGRNGAWTVLADRTVVTGTELRSSDHTIDG